MYGGVRGGSGDASAYSMSAQGEALGMKIALQSQALKGRNNLAIEAINAARCLIEARGPESLEVHVN